MSLNSASPLDLTSRFGPKQVATEGLIEAMLFSFIELRKGRAGLVWRKAEGMYLVDEQHEIISALPLRMF